MFSLLRTYFARFMVLKALDGVMWCKSCREPAYSTRVGLLTAFKPLSPPRPALPAPHPSYLRL